MTAMSVSIVHSYPKSAAHLAKNHSTKTTFSPSYTLFEKVQEQCVKDEEGLGVGLVRVKTNGR